MSLRARIVRLAIRVTTHDEIARAVGKPDFVERYRKTLERMLWSFGKLPAGTKRELFDAKAPVRGEWILPPDDPQARRVVLYVHGGAFAACSPAHYRSLTGAISRGSGARVAVPDYRLAPEYPYPAGLDDTRACYSWLLARGIAPNDIILAGDSAGGNLALSLAIALRDDGLPLPAGLVLLSPWVDLTASQPSILGNARSDDVVVLDESKYLSRAYAGDRDLRDSAVSPLFAELHGLPPMLIQTSNIEMLRDEDVALAECARDAGVDVRLHVFDGVHHVWQLCTYLPEAKTALAQIAGFVRERVR